MNKNKIKGLYIHIPFCSSICSYCDFCKMVASTSFKDKYISYLIKEMNLKKEYFNDLETIYIGGGTPSSLNLSELDEILSALNKLINLEKIKEFTIEANPNDINLDFINLIKKYHVNRISLGIETLNQKKLKLLNRTHNKKDVLNNLKLLKINDINNINADLIYAVGDESFRIIKKDIRTLKKYVTHFSCYSLILEEKTVLYKKYQKNEFSLMNEEKEAKLYTKIVKLLKALKFNHYEVSNFSINGYESKHNLIYWNNEHYIGLGLNASYYIEDTRYTNIDKFELYYNGIDNNKLIYSEEIKLNKEDIMTEFIMLGLRKMKGISLKEFKELFDLDFFEVYPFIYDLIKNDVLEFNDDYLRINSNKIYVMNEILLKFMK